jgi:lambda family phage tail tape measure protein
MSDVLGRGVIEVTADATQLKAGIEDAKRSVRDLGAEVGNSMSQGSSKAASAIDAYIKKLEFSASTIGQTARETKLLELAQRGASDAQLKAADAALSTIEAYKTQQAEARKAADAARTAAAITSAQQAAQGNSAKLTAFQMQQLSFQLNDLFVQIASGQSPLTALVQQGSQLNGTFGGLGGTMRALSTLFTASRVIFGGVAAAVAGIGYAAIEGQKQSAELAKAIALTGNAAGITEGKFNSLTAEVAKSANVSMASTRDILQSLVASGRFSGEALGETAKAAQLMSKATGQSASDVVKQFVGMTDGVAKWAETTNKSYHFLTAAQLDYIKTLEEAGNQQKAIEVTMSALNGRLVQSTSHVTGLAGAWAKVKKEASDAKEAVIAFFRNSTPEDQIARIEKQIAAFDARKSNQLFSSQQSNPREREALVAQLETLKEVQRLQTRSADQSARNAETEQAKSAFMKLQEQSLTKQAKMAKEIADANALADKAGASPSERAAVLAGIREKYKSLDLGKSVLGVDTAKIKAELAELTGAYKGAEAILEATRSAGLLSEKEYYDAKRAFINLNRDAQVSELQQENRLLQARKGDAKEQLDNQKKIAENEGKIAAIRVEAASKTEVTGLQERSAITKTKAAYEEARLAAKDYLDTLTRTQNRDLDAFGMGDKERARLAARQQIEDRYTQQRLELEKEKRLLEGLEGSEGNSMFTADKRKRYEDQLSVINEFQAKALAGWDKYYDGIQQKETDWTNGASRAMQNYLDFSKNASAQSESFFSNTFQSMEDALVQFATTGKMAFKDFANSIIAEIVRIQARQAVAGLVTSIVGSGLFDSSNRTSEMARINAQAGMPSAANGFDIPAGVNPITQLHQREMVLPAEYADVIRGMAGNGGGGSPVVVNIHNNGAKVETRPTSDGRGLDVFVDMMDNAMADRIGSGTGATSAALQGRYGLRATV